MHGGAKFPVTPGSWVGLGLREPQSLGLNWQRQVRMCIDRSMSEKRPLVGGENTCCYEPHPAIVTLLKIMRRVASSPGSTEGDLLFAMQFVVGR